MKKTIFYLRLFLWLILAVFVGFLIRQIIVPSGSIVYHWQPGSRSYFFANFEPTDRFSLDHQSLKLRDSLVYFNLKTTRPFDKLTLIITYKPQSASMIEAGLSTSASSWRYDLQPVYNQLLDRIYHTDNWGVLESDSTLLLQHQETYNSVSQFLASPPNAKSVAAYRYPGAGLAGQQLDDNFILTKDVNYIIADYHLPEALPNGFYQSQVDFDLHNASRLDDAYKIMLRVPDLSYAGLDTPPVEITGITAKFQGTSLWNFFKL